METFTFILSTLGTVCICIPPLLKGKNMGLTLLLVFLSNTFVGMSYIFTGAFNGTVSCYVGATQTIVNYFFQRKNRPFPWWLIATYALAFAIVNILVFTTVTDIFALLACFSFVMSICQKNGKAYRIWSLVNTSFWIVYDLFNLSFGPLGTHAILFATVIFGIIMHDIKKQPKKAAE